MPPYNLERDLQILEAMAAQLDPYLIEEELMWPLAGPVKGGMPRLTVGGFLLREYRLTGLRDTLDFSAQQRLHAALTQGRAALAAWPIHTGQKMLREAEMRLHLLDQFLRDCQDESGARACYENWRIEAEQRTILHHLFAALDSQPGLDPDPLAVMQATLRRVDSGLRGYALAEGTRQFLWESDLARLYPPDVFWWLWIAPAEPE